MDQSFGKGYKLCSKKQIGAVFANGYICKDFPILIKYQYIEEKLQKPFQIVISVPKRNFKKAHDRNRIKRMLREAIRKNKLLLEDHILNRNSNMTLFLVFTGKEEVPQSIIEQRIFHLFKRITEKSNP